MTSDLGPFTSVFYTVVVIVARLPFDLRRKRRLRRKNPNWKCLNSRSWLSCCKLPVLQLSARSPRWSSHLCASLSAQIARAASARWTRWTLPDTRTTVTASRTKGSQVRRGNTDECHECGRWRKRRAVETQFQALQKRSSSSCRPPWCRCWVSVGYFWHAAPGWNRTPSTTWLLVEHPDKVWALSFETINGASTGARAPPTDVRCSKQWVFQWNPWWHFRMGNVK